MKRKSIVFIIALISILGLLVGCTKQQSAEGKKDVIRIGYQKGNTLHILKSQGTLEKRLAKENIKVEWSPFPMGSVLLEALNAGSIDFGHASDGNSVFAQAGGKPVIYVASESPYPKGVAIVVPKDSPIQTVKDLKGKKVAVSKGGNQQYLLVKALEKEGLAFKDIQPVYYKDAAEARAAYDTGNVDAVGIWDPYLAILENDTAVRTIVNGENLTENRTYYFASKHFSQNKADLVKTVLEELEKSDQWANEHPTEVAKFLAKDLGISQIALEVATKRRQYGVLKIDKHAIEVQQELADTFYELKLMPKSVDIDATTEKNPKWLPENIK